MIITKQQIASLFTGYKKHFADGLTGPVINDWSKLATLVPSTTKSEDYGWLGQLPAMREWIGDRQIQNLTQHGYNIKNKKFELTVSVSRDDIEDDNLGVYEPLFKSLGEAAAKWPGKCIFDLLKLGETELCYDKTPFFNASHPVGSGVVSNFAAGGGTGWYLFDTSRALKPLIFQQRKAPKLVSKTNETDDNVFDRGEYVYGVDSRGNSGFGFWQMAYKSKLTLDETNFNTALQAVMSFKNDQGDSLEVMPTLLVVPPSLRAAAKGVVEAEKNAAGATNINFKAVEILVAPQLG